MTLELITSVSDFTKAIDSDKLVVIDFYADWCGPCKKLTPELTKVANDNKNINFYKINVDNVTEIANKYKIEMLPTIVYIKNGEEVYRTIGGNVMDICSAILKYK